MSEEREKEAFYRMVQVTIQTHPEWVSTAIQAITDGQTEHIRTIQHKMSAVEAGFSVLWGKRKSFQGSEQRRSLITHAVKSLRFLSGSETQREMLCALECATPSSESAEE